MLEKEIQEFLKNGGKIKKLPDEIVHSYRKNRGKTKFHFTDSGAILAKLKNPYDNYLSDKSLGKLSAKTRVMILSKRFKIMKKKIKRKEINQQNKLEQLTTS